LRVVDNLLDLAKPSSGEKTESLVSGVPSCLYESAPPLDEWGEGGLNVVSRACAMVAVVLTIWWLAANVLVALVG
jgi:hypothetical protein